MQRRYLADISIQILWPAQPCSLFSRSVRTNTFSNFILNSNQDPPVSNNMKFRLQEYRKCVTLPSDARGNWKSAMMQILKTLCSVLFFLSKQWDVASVKFWIKPTLNKLWTVTQRRESVSQIDLPATITQETQVTWCTSERTPVMSAPPPTASDSSTKEPIAMLAAGLLRLHWSYRLTRSQCICSAC